MQDIRETIGHGKLYVAFSGGLDSSVVAALAKIALGKEKVELVTTRFYFTYPQTLKIVKDFSNSLGLKHTFVDATEWQAKIWKGGPSCNACTRGPKLTSVKEYANGELVATGAENEDTWGQCGLKVFNGFYSPLFSTSREKVRKLADCLGIKPKKIGENEGREGCILKHLLKMMAVPNFHGAAVYKSNTLLMDIIKKSGLNFSIANAKIIGPLSKNIALINLKPFPSHELEKEIKKEIMEIDEISEVELVKKPITLEIIANPGIYNNKRSRYWIENGRLAPDFSSKIEVIWKLSKNNRLKTFSVVSYHFKS
ncbi:asparagine synthase-related protein [Mesoaciditoga sp.]